MHDQALKPEVKSARRRKTPGQRGVQRMRIVVKRAVFQAVRKSRELRQELRGRRALRISRRLSRDEVNIAQRWEWIVNALLRFGGTSAGNGVKLYCDGDERLDDLWDAIDHAQTRVWLEVYILEPDRVGNRTIESLTNAAKRGCDVMLLYDAVGSSRLTDATLAPLREAGGKAEAFNPIFRRKRRLPVLRRDHRKIVIIDDSSAFCGGMNISEDYAGKRHGNELFRDCHTRLTGPCVRDLAAVFANSWHSQTRRRLPLPPRSEQVGETFVQVLASRGYQGRQAIQRSLRIAIRNSVRQCLITTPYFVPPLRLIRAISRAAERGVEVQLLTAGTSDVPIVAMAARHIYGRLLKRGVRIFEMYGCTLHAKTITVDGIYSTVGSFNLDKWSYQRNLEVNVGMLDSSIANEIQRQFEANLESTREVTLAEWENRNLWRRLVNWTAYQLLRL